MPPMDIYKLLDMSNVDEQTEYAFAQWRKAKQKQADEWAIQHCLDVAEMIKSSAEYRSETMSNKYEEHIKLQILANEKDLAALAVEVTRINARQKSLRSDLEYLAQKSGAKRELEALAHDIRLQSIHAGSIIMEKQSETITNNSLKTTFNIRGADGHDYIVTKIVHR